ncbi:MAG: toxin HicA [bacterium]
MTSDSTYAIMYPMKGKDHLENIKNVSFADLLKICRKYFGKPRIRGSHYIFKTPWKGDPRINLQKVDKMAKFYQVRDVKKAIEKMEAKKHEE